MNSLSNLDIDELKELKSIFIDANDWYEVSKIQYEIDNRPKEIIMTTWMIYQISIFLMKKFSNLKYF